MLNFIRLRITIALISAFAGSPAIAMTLEEALEIAKGDTPDSTIIREQKSLGIAKNDALVASVYPRLDFDIHGKHDSYTKYSSNFASIPNLDDRFSGQQYGWGLNLQAPLYTFGRFGYLLQAYRDSEQLVDEEFNNNRDTYLQKVVGLFATAVLTLKTKKLTQDSLSYAEKLLRFTEIEYKRGNLTKIDLLRSQSFKAQSEVHHHRAKQAHNTAISSLKHALGLDLNQPLEVSPDMRTDSRYFQVATATDQTTAIKIAQLQSGIASNLREYRFRLYLPEISLFAGTNSAATKLDALSQDDSVGDIFKPDRFVHQVGIRLTWNLFNGFGTTSEYRKAQAEANIARLTLGSKLTQNKIQIKDTKNKLQADKDTLAALKKSAEAARLYFEHLDLDFRNGAVSLSETLEAEKELAQIEKDVVAAYVDIVNTTTALKILLGQRVF